MPTRLVVTISLFPEGPCHPRRAEGRALIHNSYVQEIREILARKNERGIVPLV